MMFPNNVRVKFFSFSVPFFMVMTSGGCVLETAEEGDFEEEGVMGSISQEIGVHHTNMHPSGTGRVKLASNLSEDWKEAFRYAVEEWRKVGVPIKVASSGANIISVGYGTDPQLDTIAISTFPANRTSWGSRIKINTQWWGCDGNGEQLNKANRRFVAMHELGHSFGLTHPGEGHGLAGVNYSSWATTLMPRACLVNPPSKPTAIDRAAVRRIFP